MKKLKYFFITILLFPLLVKSQAGRQVCADTAFDNTYFSNNFIISGLYGLITLHDNSKLVTTVGGSTSGSADGLYGLAKIAADGTPMWHQFFKCNITGLYFNIQKTIELANGDIIIGGILLDSTESVIPSYVFIKINTAGNILWQHSYPASSDILQPTRQTIKVASLYETDSGGFAATFDEDRYRGYNLTCFAADGTIL